MSPARQYRLGRTVAAAASLTALLLSEQHLELALLLLAPAPFGVYGMLRGLERGA